MQPLLSAIAWPLWLLAGLATFLLGISKAGIKGIDILIVLLLAYVFGGKTSTGVLLPLLSVADVAAVLYYKRHIDWKHFWRLLPWVIIGVLVGVWIGKDLDERLFKKLLAGIVLVAIGLMLWLESQRQKALPQHTAFRVSMGLAAGVTTMLGNLAGSFTTVYFLAQRLPKQAFIGTIAWLFLLINLFKMPFQIWAWNNINSSTLITSLYLIPTLFLGFGLGIYLVNKLSDERFRRVILYLTFLGALALLFQP